MNIKEWNSVQRWIDSLCKKSAAKGEFYIKRIFQNPKTDDGYFSFNEKNNDSIVSGFTIIIYDYDCHAYATKFFKFNENKPTTLFVYRIEEFLRDKGAWEEEYEFNVK